MAKQAAAVVSFTEARSRQGGLMFQDMCGEESVVELQLPSEEELTGYSPTVAYLRADYPIQRDEDIQVAAAALRRAAAWLESFGRALLTTAEKPKPTKPKPTKRTAKSKRGPGRPKGGKTTRKPVRGVTGKPIEATSADFSEVERIAAATPPQSGKKTRGRPKGSRTRPAIELPRVSGS